VRSIAFGKNLFDAGESKPGKMKQNKEGASGRAASSYFRLGFVHSSTELRYCRMHPGQGRAAKHHHKATTARRLPVSRKCKAASSCPNPALPMYRRRIYIHEEGKPYAYFIHQHP